MGKGGDDFIEKGPEPRCGGSVGSDYWSSAPDAGISENRILQDHCRRYGVVLVTHSLW